MRVQGLNCSNARGDWTITSLGKRPEIVTIYACIEVVMALLEV